MRRGDASRHETGLQVFGEPGVPAEVAKVMLRQRRFSFEKWIRQHGGATASFPKEVRRRAG